MSVRSKKLVGTIVLLLWIPVYAIAAMAVGVRLLPHSSGVITFLFYLLAGILWAIPVGLMFPWMHREKSR